MPDSRGAETVTTSTTATRPGVPTRREVELAAYASFILVGWSSLFVPSLLRILQTDFARTDAEFGLVYLIGALMFATGALSSGLIAGRFGRGVVGAAGALFIAGGFALEAIAPSWPVFLFGAALAGGGCGATDAIGNSVIMDLATSESGSGLNRLHLFYSVGALLAPIAIGVVIGIGVEWRLIAIASSVAGVVLARPLLRAGSIPARPAPPELATAVTRGPARLTALQLALAGLGLAIACYVAAESGVSSWLVGYLADEPMTTATLALSLFWVGIAAGRIVASRIAGRFDPVQFTAACAWTGGIAILAAVGLASGPLRIGLFLAAGFAFGPVYPMIMAVAGSLFPHRAAAVAGLVTSAGVVGSVSYPPLMGLIAGYAGLGAGMLGAAVLIFLGGATVAIVGRLHNDSQRRQKLEVG
jgi:fucose permease